MRRSTLAALPFALWAACTVGVVVFFVALVGSSTAGHGATAVNVDFDVPGLVQIGLWLGLGPGLLLLWRAVRRREREKD